jgi:hypothetical protein
LAPGGGWSIYGHEQAPVSQAIIDEFGLDSLDGPVYHVTRGNTVCARLGIRKRYFGYTLCRQCRGSRIDRAVLVEDDPTMPVRGVLT